MRNGCLAFIGIGFSLLLTEATASTKPTTDTEAAYNRLYALERRTFSASEQAQSTEIARQYQRDFASLSTLEALRRADSNDLGFIYRAAYLATFYLNDNAHFRDMRLALIELERRKEASDEQRAMFYRSMIGLRRFEDAREYLAKHPGLEVEQPPATIAVSDDRPPIVYDVSADGRSLTGRHFDIDQGTKLVIVSHPFCAFSRRAMETLASDGALAPVITRYATWLTPVDQRLNLEELSKWNKNHEATPVVIARHRSDWPMFHTWATPQFYLIKDGNLLGSFSGWPKEGSRDKLVELLSKAGL